MKASTVLLAVLIASASLCIMAQQYPGCKTDKQCQSTGDNGAYCKPNGYCHCSSPGYNMTIFGYCVQQLCFDNANCRTGGDNTATCNPTTHGCECKAPYGNAPSPAFCLYPACTSDAQCQANGDSAAYCQSNGACHCDVSNNYAQYPAISMCTIPPWVTA